MAGAKHTRVTGVGVLLSRLLTLINKNSKIMFEQQTTPPTVPATANNGNATIIRATEFKGTTADLINAMQADKAANLLAGRGGAGASLRAFADLVANENTLAGVTFKANGKVFVRTRDSGEKVYYAAGIFTHQASGRKLNGRLTLNVVQLNGNFDTVADIPALIGKLGQDVNVVVPRSDFEGNDGKMVIFMPAYVVIA